MGLIDLKHLDGTDAAGGLESDKLIPLAVSAMFDLGGHPELLATEFVSLLKATRCASRIEVTSRKGVGDVVVLSQMALVNEATNLSVEGNVTFSLGSIGDAVFQMHVCPRMDACSRAVVASFQQIAARILDHEVARRERREKAALWPVDDSPAMVEGFLASGALAEVLKTAQKIASTNLTVLITGETGTGKEVLARAIHDSSSRAGKPFIPFNCTAVPRDLLDSQLFGYRRGAFTGAQEHFAGVIRAATGGTIFLDEIGELGLDVQPKLLRFLESTEVHPLGETHPLKVDVRILAATNLSLDQLVTDGRFREDLYYRLNVIRFELPPLRDRREEISPLVQFFLSRYMEELQKENLRMGQETMEYLLLYNWPGNVRQLANEIRRIVALGENGAVIMPEHLSREIVTSRRTMPASEGGLSAAEIVVRLDQPLSAAVNHLERSMLQHALKTSGGHVEQAARQLGLSRKGLYLKRHRLGVHDLGAASVSSAVKS